MIINANNNNHDDAKIAQEQEAMSTTGSTPPKAAGITSSTTGTACTNRTRTTIDTKIFVEYNNNGDANSNDHNKSNEMDDFMPQEMNDSDILLNSSDFEKTISPEDEELLNMAGQMSGETKYLRTNRLYVVDFHPDQKPKQMIIHCGEEHEQLKWDYTTSLAIGIISTVIAISVQQLLIGFM